MQRTRRTLGWTLIAVLLVALAVTSFKAFAEPAFSRQIAGSSVVMMYPGGRDPHLRHVYGRRRGDVDIRA